ncbi:hypothetical protein D3C87_1310530 [compost metagenome]
MPKSSIRTAQIIATAMTRRNKVKSFTRFQLSIKAIGELSERSIVTPAFLSGLSSALVERGWSMFQVSNTTYSFIKLSSASMFRKISAEQILADLSAE